MKKILNLLLSAVIISNLNAQSKIEKAYFDKTFTDTFKNESIVINKYFKEYEYIKSGVYDYKVNVVIRVQYKLNDISALNTFTMMSKKNDLKRYELKQVKKNGKVNVIYEYYDKKYPDDGYDPEEMDEKQKKEENIPLEDLEIGDLIDVKYEFTYTTKNLNPRKVMVTNGKFEDTYIDVPNHQQLRSLEHELEYLIESYAVVSKLIVYNVPSEIGMVQKSFNTSFKFTQSASGDNTIFECLATLIPAYKSQDFSYGFYSNPIVRYALIQTNVSKKPFYPYQFESENVAYGDIVALGRKIYRDKTYYSHFLAYKSVAKKPEWTYTEKDIYQDLELKKFFKAFVKTFCKKDKNKYETLNKFHEYITNNDELNTYKYNDMAAAVLMGRFCKYLGLKYEMMAAMPRYDGNWNQVVSPYDITWGLHLPRKGGDLYITDYSEKSNIYQRMGALANTEIILFDPNKDLPFITATYPETKAEDNMYEIKTNITALEDDESYDYNFVNSYTLTGFYKYSISPIISNQFSNEELRNARFYGLIDYSKVYNLYEFSSMSLYDEFMRVDSFWTLYFKDYHSAQMTYFTAEDYDFRDMELDSAVIQNHGDFEDNDSAIYRFRTHFRTSGLVDNTDSDSMKIINLGMLVTPQFHLSTYQIENRDIDIYNSNLKTIHYVIEMDLPAGYSAVNLDDFNVQFENEAGVFKSVAVIEDGILKIDITKTYKFHYLPKEQWNLIISFLQTAEKYYLKRLIITK